MLAAVNSRSVLPVANGGPDVTRADLHLRPVEPVTFP